MGKAVEKKNVSALEELTREISRDFGKAATLLYRIQPREGGLIPFVFFPEQLSLVQGMVTTQREMRPVRELWLKCRQAGHSTLAEAWTSHHIMWSPRTRSITVAHDDDTTTSLFSISKTMYEELPADLRPRTRQENRRELMFAPPHGGSIRAATAGYVNIGRGKTHQYGHLCLSGKTGIVLASGDVVPIEEAQAGMRVVTHTGQIATVKRVWSRPAEEVSIGGTTIKIRTWNDFAIGEFTLDHELWTSKGWMRARDIRPGDFIGSPKIKRPYSVLSLRVPDLTPIRPQGGGIRSRSGAIDLTRESGFFFGYYLAEGCIKKQTGTKDHQPLAVLLCAHEDELRYQERAIKSVISLLTSWKLEQRETKAVTAWLFGSNLAAAVRREFGETDGKRIPEWVFDAPKTFRSGLVEGYIAGDGSKGLATHKGYTDPSIFITSVRLRLLTQLRRVIASLDWGWCSLYERPEYRDDRGWKCKRAWTLSLSGQTAIRARKEMGWPGPKWTKKRSQAQKWDQDESMVWRRVFSVAEGCCETVWDLEVDHEDHSFETVIGAVANSEVDYWLDPLTAMDGIMETIPLKAGTSIIVESTASRSDGWLSVFWDACRRQESGDFKGMAGFVPRFTPWWKIPVYVLDFPVDMQKLDEYERSLVMRYGCTAQQIAWYRAKRSEMMQREPWGGARKFSREYPANEEEAFVASGHCIFPDTVLKRAKESVLPAVKSFRLIAIGNGDIAQIPAPTPDEGDLWMWEPPNPNFRYMVGIDVSDGVGQSESVASVWRYPGYVQVAEWGSNVSSPEHTAWVGRFLANLYGGQNVTIIPEINKSGVLVLYLLQQLSGDFSIFRWRYLNRPGMAETNNPVMGWDCVDPESRILTADLRWVPARQIKEGDQIIGCEEHTSNPNSGPALRMQTVESRRIFVAPKLEVELEDGRVTRVSDNHPFWVGRTTEPQWKWIRADKLRPGDMVKAIPVWEEDRSYEAGRLSGLLDGEGHLSQGVKVKAIRDIGEGLVVGLSTGPDHTLIADGIVGHNTNHATKKVLAQVANMVFLRDQGTVRSWILYEQMKKCVELAPANTWGSAGKNTRMDRVLSAMIALTGIFLEFEDGSVEGISADRKPPEPERPVEVPFIDRAKVDMEWARIKDQANQPGFGTWGSMVREDVIDW